MANPAARAYKRVGDYDRTFGESLDAIEGQEVFIHDFSVGMREMTREGETGDRPFTTVEVSTEPEGPTKVYHTWSESIAEKMGGIPKDDLPVVAVFKRVTTGRGREVWDVS